MALLPSLPETAHLSDVLKRFPKNIAPLLTYINAVLRGPGALSVGQRELIAAYVSGLNACRFCYGSHALYAEAFGFDTELIANLVDDLESADIDQNFKPLLAYVKKLNQLPPKLVSADAQAVFDAGWSEEALFEAIEVTGVFNLMNRVVEGSGVNFDYAGEPKDHTIAKAGSEALEDSYLKFLTRLEARTA